MRIAAAALFALALTASAQETVIHQVSDPKTDTRVQVVALFTQIPASGYLPFRVTVSNNLMAEQSARLSFNSQSDYSSKRSASCTFSFSAEPGKTVTRDILVPITPDPTSGGSYNSINVTLTGSLGSSSNHITSDTPSGHPDVLLSESLFTPNASALDSALTSSSAHRYGSGSFAAKFDPKQLPSDWLAYSGYDSMLLTDEDWSYVPPGPRNAILSWVRLGGQLVIHTFTRRTLAGLSLPEDSSFGNITLRTIGTDRKLPPKETVRLVQKDNSVRSHINSQNSDYESGWPIQKHFGSKHFRYAVFILVLIAFAVLVGPVNLFVFAKSGQRHKLFITTPVISLAASLLLVILIIFQDGFGGAGARRVLMEVRPDAGQNAAFLHQEQFSRTGILTGSRFTTEPTCFLSPVPIAESRWARYTDAHDASGAFNLQPLAAGKMNASGDWFQSRSEHGHIISAVVPTRGRIEQTNQPGQLVSSFDFPIQSFFYLDDSGQWHRAENIETGKPFALTRIDPSIADPAITNEANAFARRNRELLTKAAKRTGHYVAITDSAPAIDTLPSIRWKETQTVITGPVTR